MTRVETTVKVHFKVILARRQRDMRLARSNLAELGQPSSAKA
jgi:hypothetical protein